MDIDLIELGEEYQKGNDFITVLSLRKRLLDRLIQLDGLGFSSKLENCSFVLKSLQSNFELSML